MDSDIPHFAQSRKSSLGPPQPNEVPSFRTLNFVPSSFKLYNDWIKGWLIIETVPIPMADKPKCYVVLPPMLGLPIKSYSPSMPSCPCGRFGHSAWQRSSDGSGVLFLNSATTKHRRDPVVCRRLSVSNLK